ncbi:YaaL family protein [Evansella tamaricis]|uniref:YaaL family protein n=1 Tax=Evansella tamaricis TaxID=2069301 RepID=A0ABS6JB27_9BACI|nr:YaaL family protein [Evansella tamaricis]MBU9710640.1 YaaL family protein [Evansella tamaricis]
MLFVKKGKLRKEEDNRLLSYLDILKKRVKQRESLLDKSIDHHNDVIYRAKIEKAKYIFLLKEARVRRTRLGK